MLNKDHTANNRDIRDIRLYTKNYPPTDYRQFATVKMGLMFKYAWLLRQYARLLRNDLPSNMIVCYAKT
jgi:hypothetical protein